MVNFKTKYRHIVAWGKIMGSYDYYVNRQLEEAEATNAPITAIYRDGDEW